MICKLPPNIDLEEVIAWLSENVGPAIPSWRFTHQDGRGWNAVASVDEDPHAQIIIGVTWKIEIEDEKLATLFALRWM